MNPSQYDVIGGGGGGASAFGLAERGLRVLVLEAGPAYQPQRDYLLDKPQWELQQFPAQPDTEGRHSYAAMQALDPRRDHLRSHNHIHGFYNKSNHRESNGYQHVRGVGGSTLHFQGEAHRMHPEAMRLNSRFNVGADWPVDYTELEPYYTRVETIVGVAGPATDYLRPRRSPCPLPPHALSYASNHLARGMERIGLRLVPNNLAVLSRPYDGRPPCNYCNNCHRGCPRTDKGSVDVTFIRKARATGRCEVHAGIQVVALRAGSGDRVISVHAVNSAGELEEISVRAVIVACGAVETPRLLLASANVYAPDGLANESGLVGRNLMETLSHAVAGLHPEPMGSWRGLPVDAICWDHNAPDAIPDVVGGCRYTPAASSMDLVGPVNYAQHAVPGWGHRHKDGMRRTFGHVLALGGIGEFLPNDGTYVDLDPRRKDAYGVPLARIHSLLTEMDLDRLSFMDRIMREGLDAAGVDRIIETVSTYDLFNTSHVFGTCRMGHDPAASVVDPYCRSHRWRNLFILDGSVFPSSGSGESPSLTIEALALRAADHIRELTLKKEL